MTPQVATSGALSCSTGAAGQGVLGSTPFSLGGIFNTVCHITVANKTVKDPKKRRPPSGPTPDVVGAYEESQNLIPPSKAPTSLGLTPCL